MSTKIDYILKYINKYTTSNYWVNCKLINYKVSESCNNSFFSVRTYNPADVVDNFPIRLTYTDFNQTRVPGVDASQLYIHVATIPVATNKELGYKVFLLEFLYPQRIIEVAPKN
jgi:hypothetical protein